MATMVKGRPGVFLPETFAHRGYAVPFTTPVLAYARLRCTAAGSVEYLIPGLAGGQETYVVPRAQIGDIVSMTVYDRALADALAAIGVLSCETIRNAVHKVSLTGLNGPSAKRQAEVWVQRDLNNRTMILSHLIAAAVDQLGSGDDKPSVAELATAEGRNRAKAALTRFSDKTSLTPNRVFGMLEEWSRLVMMVGSPNGEAVGPAMVTVIDLERVAAELSFWLSAEPEGPAMMAQRSSAAAKDIAGRARSVLSEVNRPAENMEEALRYWGSASRTIEEFSTRMLNIVDGWERIICRWDEAMSLDRVDQREMLANFAPHLPMLPSESLGNDFDFWANLRESQMNWSNEIDGERETNDFVGSGSGGKGFSGTHLCLSVEH